MLEELVIAGTQIVESRIAVAVVYEAGAFGHYLLLPLVLVKVVIAKDIAQGRLFHTALESDEMVESLVAFGQFRPFAKCELQEEVEEKLGGVLSERK